jgi:hypothetical protein
VLVARVENLRIEIWANEKGDTGVGWSLVVNIYPNIDKYLWNLVVTFQLDPMIGGFDVMLNSVKLDSRTIYAKIRI